MRKPIGKKVRFDVFKRDGFACQYCGATPPGALLQVDHITPVAEGGGNDIDNLVTSCQPCNIGKGARSLAEIPASLSDRAAEIRERESQLDGYNEVVKMQRERKSAQSWEVADVWCDHFGKDSIPKVHFSSIGNFVEKLGVYDCIDAMESAVSRVPNNEESAFKYFCGICWNKIRERV